MLRNSLKNDPREKALAVWSNAFDANKLGEDWIKHLMDITRKGMGLKEPAVESTIKNILNNINHQDINEIKTVVMQAGNKFRTLQYELQKRNIKVGQAMNEAIKTGLRIL
jgi:ribosomal protein L7/L12